jgi:hypothetical protein
MSATNKPKSRLTLLPVPEHMSQAEVILYLKRQVFTDATEAGWLAPCARKKSGRGEGSVYYATREVQDVSGRIAAGEYPQAKEEGRAA